MDKKIVTGQKIFVKENDVRFRKPLNSPEGIEKLAKGEELLFVDGPWFRVSKGDQTGWIHADFVSENNPNPTLSTGIKFVPGEQNPATSTNSTEVRRLIKDILGGGYRKDFLQCTEYVSYRLKLLGIDIKWPVTSGRNGGKWASIFEAAKLYKILTEPQVNCAMCFTSGISQDPKINEIGHVAFVEEVLNDGSVKISEANWPRDGIYNERIIPKDKWKNQYKARFVYFQ